MAKGKGKAEPSPLEAVEKRPEDEALRLGKCPKCGRQLYSVLEYIGGKGYDVFVECEGVHKDPPLCDFRIPDRKVPD